MSELDNCVNLENKSVNVTSDDFITELSPQQDEPLENIRQHLQNVIDEMGDETPQCHFTTRTTTEAVDGDKDDSYYESTSVISSVIKFKQVHRQEQTSDTLDSSEIAQIPPDSHRTEAHEAGVQVPSSSQRERQDDKPCLCPNHFYGLPFQQPCFLQCPGQAQPIGTCQMFGLVPMASNIAPHVSPLYQSRAMVHQQTETSNVYEKSQCADRVVYAKPHTIISTQQYKLPFVSKKKWSLLKQLNQKYREPCTRLDEGVNLYAAAREHNPPEKLVFEMVTGIPQPSTNTISTNTKADIKTVAANTSFSRTHNSSMRPKSFQMYKYKFNSENVHEKHDKEKEKSWSPRNHPKEFSSPRKKVTFPSHGNATTKAEVYYFDHGNCGYYSTTDTSPLLFADILGERTEHYARKFWAEFFATAYIGVAFFTAFVLQLFKFILYGILRPLIVGILQLGSDYFFKPFLSILFNGIVQPILIFFYNVLSSLRDLCDPVAEGCGYFLREIARLCRSIRLCDYKTIKSKKCKTKETQSVDPGSTDEVKPEDGHQQKI